MIKDYINKIIAKDNTLGELAQEIDYCASEKKYMAALACLFILVEHSIKYSLGELEGNFGRMILLAKERNKIDEKEFKTIDELREFRNFLFHQYHPSMVMKVNGIFYNMGEPEARKSLFDEFYEKCLAITLKLVDNP